ncbi:uncharacterized protein LOC110715454 [Chenopodium quinoa]|uniref:uncharacterized protein LOC110715454 n=1 Tax=Chenopodium quinoa TaxID=63459 RepID=UPI000B78293B|nr:uncharacterized protein LOC110715454 [Chenopodium quinoa]
MVEDLPNDFEKIRLTDDESKVIGENSVDDDDSNNQIALSLVGKLLTSKPFNVEAMKRTLISIWKLHDNVSIKMLEPNLFVSQFYSEADREMVLDGCPWFFDGKLIVIREINGEEQPSEVFFHHAPMWVRLVDVPFSKRNKKTLIEIGDFLGTFLEIDDTDPLGWGEFVRMKVMIDVGKPLRRGLFLVVGTASSKWVTLKYERLDEFCFFCGRLDHTDSSCSYKDEASETNAEIVYQYGPWLRASPRKTIRKPASEIEREKKLKERLTSARKVRIPSYNDPDAVKLGPPGVARKLQFPPPRPREASLVKAVGVKRKFKRRNVSSFEGVIDSSLKGGNMKGTGQKRNLREEVPDDLLISETQIVKKQKLENLVLAGDGINQVRGVGLSQPPEKQ